jgi:hypothetical protein
MQVTFVCKLNRNFCLLHDCERLHSRVCHSLGARDKGKNSGGDTIVLSLRAFQCRADVMILQRF